MTIATPAPRGRAASPAGAAIGRSLLQAVLVGAVCVIAFVVFGESASALSALFGLVVATVTFGCTTLLTVAPLRRADPQIMFLAALTLYALQMIALLVVYDLSGQIAWLDGVAVGVTILVVALVWQAAQMVAWRRARTLVFDEQVDRHG